MDIYTASQRLDRRFEVPDGPNDVGSHGLVGDGFTCALIGVDGSVGWLCLPRFDSPSVFARLLDAERGGTFRVSPAERPFESQQAYDTSTAVLQTLFRRPGEGTVCLTDSMPWNGDPRSAIHELHRFLECREGALDMEVVFDPRFDYGRGETRIKITENGVAAEGPGGERLSLAMGNIPFERRPEGGAVARFTLRSEQRMWAVMSWRSGSPEKIAAYRPFDHLRHTRSFWRSWTGRLEYDGPWRHDVLRSAITLKLLQYAPTGAMVAAPTTSIPVCPGGDRNWDYRYSWIRDAAMAVRTMNLIGYPDEALGFFHFVRDTVDARGELDLMVRIDGQPIPDEVILHHLSGFDGSGRVRIGNAASLQVQHDIIGPLLDAAYLHEQSGGTLGLRLWRQIRRLVNQAVESADQPDHGIWEPRAGMSHHVHSKLMGWVAIDRALRLSPRFGGDREETAWRRALARVHGEVLKRGYDADAGTFVGVYGGHEVDATLLLLPIFGFLPPGDPRIGRTIQRVIDELGDGRYLRRYRSDDGIDADEGGFVLCGFWLAEALALVGRLDEALEVFNNHLSATNHLGLLAEEVAPSTGAPLGNYPQAFSHLGLIQAAARLDLALRQRDEGIERPPYLAVDCPPGT